MAACCSRITNKFCERFGLIDKKEPDISQDELLTRLQNVGRAVGQPWAAVDQREYWDRYGHHPVHLPPRVADQPKHLIDALRSFKEEKVEPGVAVDLGCGNTPAITLLLKLGWSVVAVDSSRQALECLSKRISDTAPDQIKNVRLVCAKMETFKFPENVKLIFAKDSLVYCNPKKIVDVWDRAYKSLVSGGRIVGNFFPHPFFSSVEAQATKASGLWFTEEAVVKGLLHRNSYEIELCRTTPRYYDLLCQPRAIEFIGRKK